MQKTALVTGAGSGIGRAVALAMQSVGYSVVAAGRRPAELEKTAAAASSSGRQILPVPTDVSKPDSVRALFARIRETLGRLNVLFNNAGISAPPAPTEDLSYEQWTAVVAVNLNGVFLCAQIGSVRANGGYVCGYPRHKNVTILHKNQAPAVRCPVLLNCDVETEWSDLEQITPIDTGCRFPLMRRLWRLHSVFTVNV